MTAAPTPPVVQAVLALLQQSRRHLDILSEDLLPGLLDQAEILEQLRRLATSAHLGRIRLLSRNTELTARNGHALFPLAQRLPSIFQARLSEPDRCTTPYWMMLADGKHLLMQQEPDGTAVLLPEIQARLWQERFDECWEHGQTDPYLRRLSL